MNTQLVESIVQLIKSLTPEEQALVEAKLHPQEDLEAEEQKLWQLKKQIFERRNHQPFDPPIEEYVHITREERNAQHDELMSELFGQKNQ